MSDGSGSTPSRRKGTLAIGAVLFLLAVAWFIDRMESERSPSDLGPNAGREANGVPEPVELADMGRRTEREELGAVGGEARSIDSMERVVVIKEQLGSLSGVVQNEHGDPIDGAWVRTHTDLGEFLLASSDAEGRYNLEGVPFGDRRVNVGDREYHELEESLAFTEEAPELVRDFVLSRKQAIRVRLVTRSGHPTVESLTNLYLHQWNLVPVATREDPGTTFTGVQGSLNNRFGIGSWWYRTSRFPALAPEDFGVVLIHEEGPAWLSLVAAHQVLRKQVMDETTEVVTFTLDEEDVLSLGANVRGRLVAVDSGEAITGTYALSNDPFAFRTDPTGADGLFSIEGKPPGDRFLIVSAPGRAELVLPITLDPGETLELGDLQLHNQIALTGTTVDVDGEPVAAELEWGLFDPKSGEVDWVRQRSCQSDATGVFRLAGLAPGVWVIRCPRLPARPPTPFNPIMVALPIRVDARDGSVKDIELVLHETSNLMLVAEDIEAPWPVARVFDGAGLPVAATWIGQLGAETALRVPPGEYLLVVERKEQELERRPVRVGTGPTRLELVFEETN